MISLYNIVSRIAAELIFSVHNSNMQNQSGIIYRISNVIYWITTITGIILFFTLFLSDLHPDCYLLNARRLSSSHTEISSIKGKELTVEEFLALPDSEKKKTKKNNIIWGIPLSKEIEFDEDGIQWDAPASSSVDSTYDHCENSLLGEVWRDINRLLLCFIILMILYSVGWTLRYILSGRTKLGP